eukprot:168961_1
MSTSVLFVFIIKVVTSQNATDACVWGRDESARDGINGQFIFQGYFSKAPWYKKQYGTDIRYMFLSNTRYVISGEEPVKGWPGLHAECATTGTSLYPWDCGLNWRVYAGQWTDDPDVYCQMGPCPEWECDAIITDIQYMGCDDIFPVKIRSNAWSNLNGDRYFYFDYPRFRWVCDESLTYSSTTSSLLAYSERTWIDTTKGSTVPILFSPFNQIQQIQCVQNIPTLSPVKKPDEPTSKTDEPTSNPSFVPTKHPTLFPIKNPSMPPINAILPPTSSKYTPIPSYSSTLLSLFIDTKPRNSVEKAPKDVDILAIILYIIISVTSILIAVYLYRLLKLRKQAEGNRKQMEAKQNSAKNANTEQEEKGTTNVNTGVQLQETKQYQRKRAVSSSSISELFDTNFKEEQTAGVETVVKENEGNVIETAGKGLEGCNVMQHGHKKTQKETVRTLKNTAVSITTFTNGLSEI